LKVESVNVYEAIESERRYQDRKWGTDQHQVVERDFPEL